MALPALPLWNWTLLACLLLLAVWQDMAYRRIPNTLLLCTAPAALVLAAMPQGVGMGSAMGAAVLTLLAFMPLYLLRQMGAGDLKLMATAGLLVGMPRVAALCLSIAMAGGLLALGWRWLAPRAPGRTPVHWQRMPYALAIAAGSAAHSLLPSPLLQT